MKRPPTYQKQAHVSIQQGRDCVKCGIGIENQAHNKRQELIEEEKRVYHHCVGGAGPDNLQEVKLIVISDFVGHYENLEQFPMVDISKYREERRKGLLAKLNAGAILRMALKLMYGLNTYNDCWITNAIKCYPGKVKPLDMHIKACAITWLTAEFQTLDETIPEVPILIAGGQALKGLAHVYKRGGQELLEYGLQGCRRRRGLKLGDHPVVVTFNPATAARSQPKLESEIRRGKGEKIHISRNEWLYPLLPGSPVDKFIRDLHLLADYLPLPEEEKE